MIFWKICATVEFAKVFLGSILACACNTGTPIELSAPFLFFSKLNNATSL